MAYVCDSVVAHGQSHVCSVAIYRLHRWSKTQIEVRGLRIYDSPGREGATHRREQFLGSDLMQEMLMWRMENEAATVFRHSAVPLPLAQETAGGEYGNVGGVGQLFICDVEPNPFGDTLTNALGKTQQHLRKPLASSAGDQCHVGSKKPCQMVRREW